MIIVGNRTIFKYPSNQAGKENIKKKENEEAAPIEVYKGEVGLDHQTQNGRQSEVEGLDKDEMDKGLCPNHSKPNRRKWKLKARAMNTKEINKFSPIASK